MLRFWALKLLSQGKKTGYQLIKELEGEIGWQPSPGSVYPLLSMLAKEGLLVGQTVGNKVYWELTPAGRTRLDELGACRREWLQELEIRERAVWKAFGNPNGPMRLLPGLAQLASEAVGCGRGPEAARILTEAGSRLRELVENDR
ncbi:MAG: PadR family transcriptional regulator [Candidatus Bipolaricaulaceae bacterium]